MARITRLTYPLHPIDDCARGPQDDVLDSALSDDLCLNIAITGTYGAGKSSFLRSYFKRLGKKVAPIWISLLDFCEIKHDQCDTDQFESRLEIGILQHILYSCKAEDVTYSNIARPATLTIGKAFLICLYWMSWCGFAILIFNWKLVLAEMLRLNALDNFLFVAACSFFISWLVVPFIIWASILCRTKGLSAKLNFYGAEVDVSSIKSASPVNVALCELISFFADTKRTLVVFEDIDRSGNRRIFTKLREACIAINRSPLIKSRVRFIYCIKDDVFEVGEERTKFFDCIIPILPYVNSHNVRALFATYMREGLGVENLSSKVNAALNALSRFVSDARTLNNICMEFFVHRKALIYGGTDDATLLGLIMLKNLLPKEYGGLSDDRCAFRKIVALKNEIIYKKCDMVEVGIKKAKDEFDDWMKNNSPESCKKSFAKDELVNFRQIRAQKQSSIAQLEVELERIKSTPLITLLHRDEIHMSDVVRCFPKGSERWMPEFMYTLVDNGYLSESYLEYISLFHEGHISATDKKFVVNALSYKRNGWEIKLAAPAIVLGNLPSRCFSHSSVLNFSLLSFMLKNSKVYADKLTLLLNMLGRLVNNKGLEFVDAYLSEIKNPHLAGRLALLLCRNWPDYQDVLLENNTKGPNIKLRQVAGLLKAARTAGNQMSLSGAVWRFLDELTDISLLWSMDTCTKNDIKLAIAKFHFGFPKCSDVNLRRHGIDKEVLVAREYMRKKRELS